MDDKHYQTARNRVIQRLGIRFTFIFNLIFFLLIFTLILRDRPTGDDVFGVAIFVLIWGSVLLLHGGIAFSLFDRLLDQATLRELDRIDRIEKPKRHALELGEDGELVDVVEDWQQAENARREAR
ncbi:MAG: hypothetical protein H6672_02530 [Anaerolineaceae bacterium]|nr:hypothetical protein [Anaerolineaceae bacterium]